MKVTNVDTIRVQVPCEEDELRAGKIGDVGFVRVKTDEGLTGWGFGEVRETLLDSLVRPMLTNRRAMPGSGSLPRSMLGPLCSRSTRSRPLDRCSRGSKERSRSPRS